MRKIAPSLLLSLALAAACPLAHSEPMTWMLETFAPVSMPVAGKPGNGITDEILKIIQENWPEVEHRYVLTNGNRAWAMLAAGTPACTVGMVRTPERDKLAYFSNVGVTFPVDLLARKDSLAKLPLNAVGEVELPRLLADPQLSGVLVDKRSYGARLDALVAARPANSRLAVAVRPDNGSTSPKMLAMGRADYTLEFDFILAYAQKQHPGELAQLQTLPIADTGALGRSAIACPRTTWGRAAIRRIDAILTQVAATPRFQQAVEKWLTPQGLRRYRKEQAVFLQERSKPTDPAQYQ